MRPTRADIIVNKCLTVKSGHTLSLDAHLFAFGRTVSLSTGELTVLTPPRKIDGINLVRVLTGGQEYETFYCDVLKHCEL